MDSFDTPIEENQQQATVEDPAAEFLAREQEELGDLGEELGITAPKSTDSSEEPFEVLEEEPKSVTPPEDLGSAFNTERMRPTEEPETIKEWKVTNQKLLAEKDKEEEKMKTEWKEKAQKDLETWYKNYNEQLRATKENNRVSEKEFVAEVNDITPGSEWERVNKLCDFNVKNSKNSKDTSRMRSVLLQLKQNQMNTIESN